MSFDLKMYKSKNKIQQDTTSAVCSVQSHNWKRKHSTLQQLNERLQLLQTSTWSQQCKTTAKTTTITIIIIITMCKKMYIKQIYSWTWSSLNNKKLCRNPSSNIKSCFVFFMHLITSLQLNCDFHFIFSLFVIVLLRFSWIWLFTIKYIIKVEVKELIQKRFHYGFSMHLHHN